MQPEPAPVATPVVVSAPVATAPVAAAPVAAPIAAPVAAPIVTPVPAAPKAPAAVATKSVVQSENKDATDNKFMIEYSKNLGDGKKIVNSIDKELQSNVLNIESTTLTPLEESFANPEKTEAKEAENAPTRG